jgi:hypothetical protein
MPETYEGILHDNRIEWSGEARPLLPSDQGVRVQVTILERVAVPPDNQGRRMAAALELLADAGSLGHIADPAAWQRETRAERPLPGRD